MFTKLFEVRDNATTIFVMASKFSDVDKYDIIVARRLGHSLRDLGKTIYLTCSTYSKPETQYDPTQWSIVKYGRTLHTVHEYIATHWNELNYGQIIDVAYILGETKEVKESEIQL